MIIISLIFFLSCAVLALVFSLWSIIFKEPSVIPNTEITSFPTETTVPETFPLETVLETFPPETVPETFPPETVPETFPPETVPETFPPETLPPTVPTEAQATEESTAKAPERIAYESVPVFYQTDYPDNLYGNGTIKSSGCSITSLSMVASFMTGHEYLPDLLADYFGGYGQNNIQRLEHASDMLQLPWKKAKDVRETLAAVREGCLAIALMNEKSIFTDSEHFIVLSGVTEDGKILVNDPYEPNYEKWNLKNGFSSGFEDYQLIQGYSGGWIYDISAMPEEPFIYVEEKPYVEPRYPDIILTEEERTLLAKVIWVEARGEPPEGQQAIAEIVFNRVLSDSFPDTVNGVLYSSNQFRSVEHLEDAKPSQAQYDAIKDALSGPYILPIDVFHFATYPVNKNVWGTIGGHIFCYQAD